MLQMLQTGIRGSCNDLVNFKLLQFIKIFNYTEISANKLILTYFLFLSSGGVCVISHRHAVANNPQMTQYDPTKEESHLFYIDANVSIFHSF